MVQRRLLNRAIELDDDYPDDVCPGCGQGIAGWQRYDVHYLPTFTLSKSAAEKRKQSNQTPMPFSGWQASEVKDVFCSWSRDYLTARQFRRAYIAKCTVVMR